MKAFKPKLALPVYAGIVLMTAQFGISSVALAASPCPTVTVADMKGVPAGMYPQQYELDEFNEIEQADYRQPQITTAC